MQDDFTADEFNDAYAEGAVQSLQSLGFKAERSPGGGVRLGHSIYGAAITFKDGEGLAAPAVMLLVNEYDETRLQPPVEAGLALMATLSEGIPIVTRGEHGETHESMAANHEKQLHDSAKSLYALAEEAVKRTRAIEKHAKALR